MDDLPRIRVNMANVAGGRLTDPSGPNGYAPGDRTDVFADAVSVGRPHVIVLSELDCGPESRQIERLSARALGTTGVHTAKESWSDSHVPGVERLGLGIASCFPLHDVQRIDLPKPPFELLFWNSGARLPWHDKGLLVARCEAPGGDVHIVAAQLHPLHIGRTPDGALHSYDHGAGREFGLRISEFIAERLAALGVRRMILAGDLNMPDPRALFSRLGDIALVDVFGPGAPPATTPDGRSIDRAFVSEELRPLAHQVIPVPGADHFVVSFEVEDGRRRAADAQTLARSLGDAPAMSPDHLTSARGHAPSARRPVTSPSPARPRPRGR
ncbi:endonuclease/exonuclease/phosphatase family protein [Nocardiopsis sediminis]|uniref:Endonuclease/exonuclease/phosphatase family protein n=1 Tax=Nocardiopsis sediminis TaxID=1778267 RepID=A0ABV8FPB9_9ACTN